MKEAETNHRVRTEQLRAFNHRKSEFLATASHEMRTPLTIIREFTNLMVDEVAGPTTAHQTQCLHSVLRNCDRLTSLLNDLLDLAKIDAGGVILKRSRLDLALVLQECVDDFIPLLHRKSQSITLEIEDELPSVLGDRSQIGQALVNFVGNSNKFTANGGQIRIKAFTRGTSAHVEVTDNGRGIEKADLPNIFEAFAHLSHDDGTGIKGTGLGLNITQKIIALHNGDVFIRSVVGTGSTFGFTLPIYTEALELEAFVQDQSGAAIDAPNRATVIAVLAERLSGGVPTDQEMDRVRALCDKCLEHAACSEILRAQGILIFVDIASPREEKSRIGTIQSALKNEAGVYRIEQVAIRRGYGARALKTALTRLRPTLVETPYSYGSVCR